MANQVTGDLTVGCNFDSATAKATHGKNIILMVFAEDGTEPIAVAGQQGLNFAIEAESSEAATKDGTGGWATKFPGVKSWSASTDGLFTFDDEGRKAVVSALVNDGLLCVGMYRREPQTDGSVKYVPIRKGIALVSSDEVEAPNDDNATFSVEFEGTGPCWCIEAAEEAEVTKATITITPGTDDNEG